MSFKKSLGFFCDDVTNENVPKGARDPSANYAGDVVSGRLCIHRTNATAGARGPWMVDAGWPKKLTFEPDTNGLSEGCADLLYGLVRGLRPRTVLETGTHKGRSTKAIASALAANQNEVPTLGAGHIYTVDMDDYKCLEIALTPEELTLTTQIVGRSPGILDAEPLATLDGIDFAFIDGAHDGPTFIKELEYVDHHRAEYCWVLIDNAFDSGWPDIHEYMKSYRKYPHVLLLTMCGMELVCMGGPKKEE